MIFIYICFIVVCVFIRNTLPLKNDRMYTCIGTPVPISIQYSKSKNHRGWYVQYHYNFNSTIIMNPPECLMKENIMYSSSKYKVEEQAQEAMETMKHETVEKMYPTELKSALDGFFFIMFFVLFFCGVLGCTSQHNKNRYFLS